jgi:hypothetical protein
MNGKDEAELRELFARFRGAKQASEAVDDIREAEQIIRDNPAPEPREELIAQIKSQIGESLSVRRRATIFRKIAYRAAAVAAAVVVLSIISIGLREIVRTGPEQPVVLLPQAVWEGDGMMVGDVDLAVFTAEIEQIEGELLTLQLGKNGGNGERAVSELEMELIEVEGDFWQG